MASIMVVLIMLFVLPSFLCFLRGSREQGCSSSRTDLGQGPPSIALITALYLGSCRGTSGCSMRLWPLEGRSHDFLSSQSLSFLKGISHTSRVPGTRAGPGDTKRITCSPYSQRNPLFRKRERNVMSIIIMSGIRLPLPVCQVLC